MSPFNWMNAVLEELQSQNQYRTLPELTDQQLNVASNDYLGLARDERLVEAAVSALKNAGAGSTGSRLTSGHTRYHAALEKRIASFKKTEAALLFSSGYLANIGVITAIAGPGDVIFSDEKNHASVIDGCRLSKAKTIVYRHCDAADLKRKLAQSHLFRRRFIVTDGVFSMDGTIAPLDAFMQLAERFDAAVVVDDAHATGVMGENGRGTGEHYGVEPHVTIGTLSKAAGVEGGFAAGSSLLIDFLRNRARPFIFQTALPPASCAAAAQAIDIIEQEPERRLHVHLLAQRLREELMEAGFQTIGSGTPIVPVVIGEEQAALDFAKALFEHGIYAPAIRPPTVASGECRIRFTVTAQHTKQNIGWLVDICRLAGQQKGLI